MSSAVNFRVKSKEALEALDQLGLAMDRDRSYLLNEALEAYIELHKWQIARIREGLKQADAHQFAPQSRIDSLLGRKKK